MNSSPAFDYAVNREGIYVRRLIELSPDARRRNELGNIVFRPHIHPIADPSHRNSILSAMMLAKRFISPEYSRKLLFGTGRVASPAALFTQHGLNILGGIPRTCELRN